MQNANKTVMEKTVEVHMKTTVWKRITIEVPEDEDPKEFLDDLMEHDPTCSDHPKEDVSYMDETEEALEGQYYLPDEDYDDEFIHYGSAKFPTMEVQNLMVLIEYDNPMRALYDLQAKIDSDALADEVVKMKKGLRYKLTVNQVLDIVQS